jgi:hypothetical protein
MLGRLFAGSGRFGDVTGLDVILPGSGIRPRKLCTAATGGATLMCSHRFGSSFGSGSTGRSSLWCLAVGESLCIKGFETSWDFRPAA